MPSSDATLSIAEVRKVQSLLKSGIAEAVLLGLSLFESFEPLVGDVEAVFTEAVSKAVGKSVNAWLQGGEQERASFRQYHDLVVRPRFAVSRPQAGSTSQPFNQLVDIPAGAFIMGSPKAGRWRGDDEDEVAVELTKQFQIARTVVTQQQWRAILGTEPWLYERRDKHHCGDDVPVVCAHSEAAVIFCDLLTDMERSLGHLGPTECYRLPTEAEWEYACRAGSRTAYSFGDEPGVLSSYGWYLDNSRDPGCHRRRMQRVAQKSPNAWGLYDMHGNVWEWCSDWYAPALPGGVDPKGPATGHERVFRGGDWSDNASRCRSACRSFFRAAYRGDPYIGLRIVRSASA